MTIDNKVPENNCFLCSGKDFMYERCETYTSIHGNNICIYKTIADRDLESFKNKGKKYTTLTNMLEEYLRYMKNDK